MDGDKIKPIDGDRASTLAAMRAAAEKWGSINVNGTARDKAIAVELAAEHGFKITNPELQEQLAAAREKVEELRRREQARERTEAEAQREVRQADRSTATHERPFDGGGDDHAYRTESEAASAVRAERSLEQNPSKPIPVDINQSPEIERQRQAQQELLNEKQAKREAQSKKDKERHKPKQRQ